MLCETRQRPYGEEVRWVFAGSTAAIITAGATRSKPTRASLTRTSMDTNRRYTKLGVRAARSSPPPSLHRPLRSVAPRRDTLAMGLRPRRRPDARRWRSPRVPHHLGPVNRLRHSRASRARAQELTRRSAVVVGPSFWGTVRSVSKRTSRTVCAPRSTDDFRRQSSRVRSWATRPRGRRTADRRPN